MQKITPYKLKILLLLLLITTSTTYNTKFIY